MGTFVAEDNPFARRDDSPTAFFAHNQERADVRDNFRSRTSPGPTTCLAETDFAPATILVRPGECRNAVEVEDFLGEL